MQTEIQEDIFIKPEYEEFYKKLAKHKDGNKMQEKFKEILSYFNNLNFSKDLILLLSQWNQDDNMLNTFIENSKIEGIEDFIKYCDKNSLLLDEIRITTKYSTEQIGNLLAISSNIDLTTFFDNN